jgi:hypothetical protein
MNILPKVEGLLFPKRHQMQHRVYPGLFRDIQPLKGGTLYNAGLTSVQDLGGSSSSTASRSAGSRGRTKVKKHREAYPHH